MNNQTESKLKPLFLENPFEKKLNELEKNNFKVQHQSKLDKMFTPKTFEERWKFCNITAILVGYICNYFSAITAFSLIFYLSYLTTFPIVGQVASVIISLVPSIAIVVAIELVKRHASDNFLQDIIQFKKCSKGMLLFLLVCSLFSIVTSYFGAKEIPQAMPSSPPSNLLNLYSLDSLIESSTAAHEKEIATQKIRVDSFKIQNSNSKGSVRYGALAAQQILESQLTDLINDKRQSVAEIKKQYQSDKQNAISSDLAEETKSHTEVIKISNGLAIAAILCEFLFFLCMGGHWWYCWKSYEEKHIEANANTDTENNDDNRNNDNRTKDDTPHTGPRIGFRKNDDNRNDDNRPKLPICKHCHTEFLPNHHKQLYCSDEHRIAEWEKEKGKKLHKTKAK